MKEEEKSRSVEHPTPTIEDYLGAIYTLARDNQPVIGRKLAAWMEVSPPTVTATIQRMIRDGWVTMAPDKTIHLTEAGWRAAASVVRRHMLTELLLARVLNVPWSKVHEEADHLEHGLSSETAERVEALLKSANLCPHGNPLPGQEEVVSTLVPLSECEPGQICTLARIHEEVERQSEVLIYLEQHGLVPGASIRVTKKTPNEAASPEPVIEVVTPQGRAELALPVARWLYVQKAV